MRVLHIINSLGSGGAEKLIEESLPLMKKKSEFEFEILLLTDEKNVFESNLRNHGIPIYVLSLKKVYNPLNTFLIRKFIIKGNYDVIHVHLFPAQLWTALAVKTTFKNKIKLLTTEHNTHNRRREKKLLKYVDIFMYSQFIKIISISKKTEENLKSWLGANQSVSHKFITIENGINIKRFKSAKPYRKSRLINGIGDNTKIVCMVGRFSEQKDQKTLIKAIGELTDNTHLILIGEGPSKLHLKEFSEKLALQDRVHFLGFRSDVERVLKSSDIVVLSSNWEGFGLAAVEGMAAGKPVIATDVPGLREVVKDAGILFTKGDYKELANKISWLNNDSSAYSKTAYACQKRAQRYDIEIMVEKYLDVYRSLEICELSI